MCSLPATSACACSKHPQVRVQQAATSVRAASTHKCACSKQLQVCEQQAPTSARAASSCKCASSKHPQVCEQQAPTSARAASSYKCASSKQLQVCTQESEQPTLGLANQHIRDEARTCAGVYMYMLQAPAHVSPRPLYVGLVCRLPCFAQVSTRSGLLQVAEWPRSSDHCCAQIQCTTLTTCVLQLVNLAEATTTSVRAGKRATKPSPGKQHIRDEARTCAGVYMYMLQAATCGHPRTCVLVLICQSSLFCCLPCFADVSTRAHMC